MRFETMLQGGALDEVRALVGLGLDPALPAMRAHGVPELAASLRGEISLDEATRRAILATGRYTKRQATWFRHRPPLHAADAHTIHARYTDDEQYSESLNAYLGKFLCRPVDAAQHGA